MGGRLRSVRTSPGTRNCQPSTAATGETVGNTTWPSNVSAASATRTAACLRPPKRSRPPGSENDVGPEDEGIGGPGERREIAAVLARALVDHADVELPGELARLHRVLLAEDHLLADQRQAVDRELGEQVDAGIVQPGEKRALEIEVRAAQAEMQRVGDVPVAVVPAPGPQAPAQPFLVEDPIALQLPLELGPVVGDEHVFLDVLGAGRDQIAEVAAVGAALGLFRAR